MLMSTALKPFLLGLVLLTASNRGVSGQNSTSTAPGTCANAPPDGEAYTVSLPADATTLAEALASCTGGKYNVTWNGAVTLEAPLVVAAESSLTIRGFQGADGEAAALDGNNATGLVDLGQGSSLRLEGVTLRNARRTSGNGGAVNAEAERCVVSAVGSTFEFNRAADLSYGEGKGGALALGVETSAELKDCIVAGNSAVGWGGGISIQGDGSAVFMEGCVFEDNASEVRGGALYVDGRSTVTFAASTVSNNFAQEWGGALYGINSTVVVEDGSLFVNNTVYEDGGGISLYGDVTLNITDSTFRQNEVLSDGSFNFRSGGAVFVQGVAPDLIAEVFIADSRFDSNFAASGAALCVMSGFKLVVTRTSFFDNQAWEFGSISHGGAAYVYADGSASFAESSFNQGGGFHGGGGIAAEDCTLTVTDCLFLNNTSRFEGGALSLRDGSVASVERTEFSDNYIDLHQSEGGTGGAISASGATLSATDSLFNNNQAGYDGETVNDVVFAGGGAVFLDDVSNASFARCNFTNNGGGDGGALLAVGMSSANLTEVVMTSNRAEVNGGALAFEEGSVCAMRDSYVGINSATTSGGGLYLFGAVGDVVAVSFVNNAVDRGSGGAVALLAASNVTILGGNFSTNAAGASGGHLFARGGGTTVNISGPVFLNDGTAAANGGAVHVTNGAVMTAAGAEMYGNRATQDGGAMSALLAGVLTLERCNLTANACGGSGGGVSVTGTVFRSEGSTFADNEAASHGGGLRAFTGADVEVENCRFYRNTARMGAGLSGVNTILVARRCEILRNTATADGGGFRVSYQSTGIVDACNVSFNTAGVDGGAIAVDASSDTTDGTLTATNASSYFRCEGRGKFEGNQAAQRGGAVYVTRDSSVFWDGCSSTKNTASLGASVYASHSEVELSGGAILEYDEGPTGAMVYGFRTHLEAINASFLAKDAPSLLAVQMTSGSSMKALACSFKGFTGPYVVHTGGLLEMDLCDFRKSQTDVFVAATNASQKARVRNTALGIESYATLASQEDMALSLNVQKCDDDPCGNMGLTAETALDAKSDDFAEQDCVDGNLGVYCPCFAATITGEEECLGEAATLGLQGPEEQLVTIGVQGTISSTLNITAGNDGGVLVWKVEAVERPYSEEGLTWSIVPNVGILEEGGLATVSITGVLNADFNGITYAQFRAVSLQSGESALAMVNTTFYYCEASFFYDGDTCVACADTPLPEGLDCDDAGVLLSTLPVSAGFWRANNNTTDIRQCLHDDACLGGTEIQSGDDYCSVGYNGPYCAVCSAGYAGSISNGCHRCSEPFKAGMYLLAAVGGLLMLGFLWLLFRYLMQEPSAMRHVASLQNLRIISKARQLPLYKLKIPIVVFQIVTQYADITTVQFPASLTAFLSYVDIVNLDVGWLFSASCIVNLDFYGRLLVATLGPLVMGAALACTFLYARSRVLTSGFPKRNDSVLSSRGDSTMSESRQLSVVKRRHMAVLVTTTFLIYSTVSTVVFQTFACDHLEDLDETYLRADYSLICNTATHKWYKGYAAVMILVYPIGIPMLYAWLLFRHRHRIYPKLALRDGVSPERRFMDKKIAHTVLLWEAYRPSRYYYEVIECARRLLLTGCLVFILPNSAGQAAVACVLSVVSVCIFITLRPFNDPNDDRLYVLGCIIVFLSMFVSLVPKVEIAEGDNQSQTVVSWLLIALSLIMAGMAVAQCCWEVHAISAGAPRTDSEDTSSGANLIGSRARVGGEERSDSSSGYKNSSPEDPNTDNPSSAELFDAVPGRHASGGSDRRGSALDANHGGEFHPSGSSAGAGSNSRRTSGYAAPVLEFGGGIGSGAGTGNGMGTGTGAASMGSDGGSASHGSAGNTYGPLNATTNSGGSRGSSRRSGAGRGGGGGGSGVREFPPMNPFDVVDDSPTMADMAEKMFSRRIQDIEGGGRLGHGLGGDEGGGAGGGGGGDRDEEKGHSPADQRARGTSAVHALEPRYQAMYPGFEEHGGEEGPRRAALRLSPAEPMNAFPAPMTNAFPASTDTPESEQARRGHRQPLGGGGLGSALSPSPASSVLTGASGDSRRQLLGPSPAASDFMPTSVEDDDGASTIRSGGNSRSSSIARDNRSKPRRLGSRSSGGGGGR